MVRKSFRLATGQQMEYELLGANAEAKRPMPFLVSVSGRDQFHVNGFSQRLASDNWNIAMALRPKGAPLLFQGTGAQGDGVWHLGELCRHLLKEYNVVGGRFVFVGVSNGGNSVLRCATVWPELCCGIVVATGSLQGLVELPGGCLKLKGIPVDMYVGTKDECGFYQPMVALEKHFKSVNHKPVAALTVFQDAGHICSPLIADFLVHGKIGLMLLHAGSIGSSYEMAVPKRARKPSDKVLAKLCEFASELDLDSRKSADGGLLVSKPGGPLLTMMLPKAEMGGSGSSPASSPSHGGYKTDDVVEVWSNSKHCWESAVIVRTLEGDEGGFQVVFEDERGKVSKMIPWTCVSDYLRMPQKSATSAGGFVVGDAVAIWSNSKNGWTTDGQVSSISSEGEITVIYGGGGLSKLVPLENVAQFLRKISPSDEATVQELPQKGPSGGHLLPPGALPSAHEGGSSRPSSSSRSPCSGGSPQATVHRPSVRLATQQVSGQQPGASRQVTPVAAAATAAANQPAVYRQASGAVTQVAPAANQPTAVRQQTQAPPTASQPAVVRQVTQAVPAANQPAAVRQVTQVAAPGQLPAARQPTATAGVQVAVGSPIARFPVGCHVAVWSETGQKWYEDGQVTEEEAGSVGVIFAGGAMRKTVAPALVPQLLRRL